MATSHKVAPYAIMDPTLWGSLPRELLVHVLARLPVPKITCMRCQLSKEWIMNTKFNPACDKANPNMAALVSYAVQVNEFSIRIFDFSKYEWLYVYRFCLSNRENAGNGIQYVWMPMAGDGRLVCFVSTWKYTEVNPLCIVVINLLTRVQHELPALQHVYTVPPTLVHMKVDSKTKGYKVVVIFKNEGLHTVEMYDSFSREWSKATPSWGRVFGRARNWKIGALDCFCLNGSRACAFDFEEGQLELLDCSSLFQSEGATVMQYVFAGDRVFVLHKKGNLFVMMSGFYFITEFQFQNDVEMWVPVRTHNQCFPGLEDWSIDLQACEGVLMFRRGICTKYNQVCSFLNFSTKEWHNLSEKSQENQYVSLMCRAFWNVIP